MAQDIPRALERFERDARVARGLPPDHILDLAEFPFKFGAKQVGQFAQACANLPEKAAAYRAFGALAVRDYPAANIAMIAWQRLTPGEPKTSMRFGIAPELPTVTLPKVSGSYPTGPALFLAASPDYLREFGVPLLWTVLRQAPETPVHVHLMAPDDAALEMLPLQVTWTRENPLPFIQAHKLEPQHYYGAARLVRFAEALNGSEGPLIMLDIDSLFNRSPKALFDIPGDIGLRVRPGRIEPWHQFSACMVMGRPGGRAYFQAVADIVRNGLARAWWGLDQYALFSAYLIDRPPLTLLGPDLADVADYLPSSVAWFTAGRRKLGLLTDMTPYGELFRQHRH